MSKINELEELQKTLEEIFIKNLFFFKQNFPLIFDKITAFEKLNIEEYTLDFIDNRFQLKNTKTQKMFYNEDPFVDSINCINNFDFSSAFSLIKLEPYEKRNHYDNEINSYLYINEFIENFSKLPTSIEKFVFIGTLLGVHINDFHKAINAKAYLIVEPNIEIFRLSMFLTDYSVLALNSKLFFSINETQNDFEQITNDFLEYQYKYNNLIYYELSSKENEFFINNLSKIFTQSSEMRYPFSEYLISLKRGYKYFLKDKKSIIDLSKRYKFLENKKVLFLGAGVSVAKNIEWIYLNQNNFIIVASSAVLKHLQILEIIPDIIILIDGQKEQMLQQFNVQNFMYKNSIILSSIKLDEDLYKKLENENIFFMQDSLGLFNDFGFLSGITVGDIGVDILLRFGANELYLLGIDAALDIKSGKTHVGTHLSSRKIDYKNIQNDKIDFLNNIIYVKGNLDPEVPTFMEYTEMIEQLNKNLSNIDNSTKVYNLSNGAYFKNSIPKKIIDINFENTLLNKKIFKNEFISNLNNISKYNLNLIDKINIQNEQKILKALLNLKIENDLIEKFQNLKEKFPISVVLSIFEKYFKLILPYYNFLEDKDLRDKILNKQISEILNKFNSIYDKIGIKL